MPGSVSVPVVFYLCPLPVLGRQNKSSVHFYLSWWINEFHPADGKDESQAAPTENSEPWGWADTFPHGICCVIVWVLWGGVISPFSFMGDLGICSLVLLTSLPPLRLSLLQLRAELQLIPGYSVIHKTPVQLCPCRCVYATFSLPLLLSITDLIMYCRLYEQCYSNADGASFSAKMYMLIHTHT